MNAVYQLYWYISVMRRVHMYISAMYCTDN